MWVADIFIVGGRRKTSVRELINRRVSQPWMRDRGFASPGDVHEQEWIAVDVDIFSNALDLLARDAEPEWPLHLPNLRIHERLPVSGQLLGELCIFPGSMRSPLIDQRQCTLNHG